MSAHFNAPKNAIFQPWWKKYCMKMKWKCKHEQSGYAFSIVFHLAFHLVSIHICHTQYVDNTSQWYATAKQLITGNTCEISKKQLLFDRRPNYWIVLWYWKALETALQISCHKIRLPVFLATIRCEWIAIPVAINKQYKCWYTNK